MRKEFMMPTFPGEEHESYCSEQPILSPEVCKKYNILNNSDQTDAQFEKKSMAVFNILKATNLLNNLHSDELNIIRADFALCTDIVSKCYAEQHKVQDFEPGFSRCVEDGIEFVLFREKFEKYLTQGQCKDNLSYCAAENLYEATVWFSDTIDSIWYN